MQKNLISHFQLPIPMLHSPFLNFRDILADSIVYKRYGVNK